MSHGGFVSPCKHGAHLRRAHGMLERQPYRWTSPTGRASAHRIDHHHHRAAAGRKEPIDIRGSPRLLDAVLSQVRAHGGDELFRVGHDSIIAGGQPYST